MQSQATHSGASLDSATSASHSRHLADNVTNRQDRSLPTPSESALIIDVMFRLKSESRQGGLDNAQSSQEQFIRPAGARATAAHCSSIRPESYAQRLAGLLRGFGRSATQLHNHMGWSGAGSLQGGDNGHSLSPHTTLTHPRRSATAPQVVIYLAGAINSSTGFA